MLGVAQRTRDENVRDGILDVASRLFDGHGVHAVGMQQIVDDYGCGKAMLYREFPTKDDLVVAYLERVTSMWVDLREQIVRQWPDDPAAQMVAVVSLTAEIVTAPGYRGCPVRNTHAEFPDEDHPVHAVAVAYYDGIHRDLIDMAKQAGAVDPRGLADRLMVIIDGINVSGAIRGREGPAGAGVAFAEEVVRHAVRPRS
jgi:AcrR family transcriptional regulator